MAFNSNLLFYYSVNGISTINQSDGSLIEVEGNPLSLSYVMQTNFGEALSLNSSFLLNDGVTSPTSSFSLGFWIKPQSIGIIEQSGTAFPLYMPICALCNTDSYNIFSPSFPQFIIYEQNNVDGTNSVFVYIANASGATPYLVQSSSYSTNIWHYFTVIYNGSSVVVYIDGIESTLTVVQGTIPSTIVNDGNSSYFSINSTAPGSPLNVVKNICGIGEIFLSNNVLTTSDISRLMSMGVIYVFDSTFSQYNEVSNQFLFNDPSTISINTMTSNNSSIYIGKSDGSFVKGSRKVWEFQQSFNSDNDIAGINAVYGENNTNNQNFSISNGILTTTNTVLSI